MKTKEMIRIIDFNISFRQLFSTQNIARSNIRAINSRREGCCVANGASVARRFSGVHHHQSRVCRKSVKKLKHLLSLIYMEVFIDEKRGEETIQSVIELGWRGQFGCQPAARMKILFINLYKVTRHALPLSF